MKVKISDFGTANKVRARFLKLVPKSGAFIQAGQGKEVVLIPQQGFDDAMRDFFESNAAWLKGEGIEYEMVTA